MLSFLNKKLKFLLIVILAVIGVSFIFFGSWTPRGGAGRATDTLAKIDGHNVSVKQFYEETQATRLIYTLTTGQMPPDGTQADNIFRAQTWNRLLVLAAAKKAGIRYGEDQAYAFIVKHPLFLDKDGKYSEEAYNNFKERILQPHGIDQKRFVRIICQQLAYAQMVQSIASTAVVQPAEVSKDLELLYGKTKLQYVEIPADPIRKTVQPSEQELQTFYNANTGEYAQPESRVVEYVKFQLDPKQAALKDNERADAMRNLSKTAYEFTNPFFNAYDAKSPLPDFNAAAKKAGLTVVNSGPFTKDQSIIDKEDGERVATSAFALTEANPVSDYLQVSDGFVVLHLLKVTPSQPKTYAEVKAQVLQRYTEFQTAKLLQQQAKTIAENIRKDLAGGKTWEQAAAAQGLKPQSLPDFVPGEYSSDGKNLLLDRAVYVATSLQDGAVSDPVQSPAGAALFHVISRSQPTAEQRSKFEPQVRNQLAQMRRQQVLSDWVNSLLAPPTDIPASAMNGSAGQL